MSGKRVNSLDIMKAGLFGEYSAYTSNPGVNRERSITINHQLNLGEMAVNRFKWEGLPPTVDPRFLEMTLFYTGLCIFYWDTDFDALLAVRGAGGGFVNMLDNPVNFTVVGPSKLDSTIQDSVGGPSVGLLSKGMPIRAYDPVVHSEITDKNKLRDLCVPVWANAFRFPDLEQISIYATRLAWIDRTLEINTKNARRTKILKTTQDAKLSAVNVIRSLDQGDELIQVTGALADMDFIEAIDLEVNPDSYEKLSLLRTRIWNEALSLFGINGANQDKKERLVAAEVGANDEQVSTMRYSALNARQDACERINKVFGTEISVDFRSVIEGKENADEAAKRNEPAKASNAENPEGKDTKKDEK